MAMLVAALLSAGGQAPPASQRPRVFGIAHVSLQTSDLAKARAFYGGVLGFAEQRPVRPNRAVFVVNARQRLIVEDGLPADRDERLLNVGFDAERPSDDARDPDGHTVQFVSMAGAADAADAPDRRISRRILHAGLTIKDPAAADKFYRDVWGFSEIWRGGRPAGTISWINMRVPDGTDYIEYMLYPSAPPTRQQLGSAHHVALLVTDIQQALETVRARTPPGDRNHRATPNIGVNNRWQLNVFDPDGTRVEFMEPFTAR
jgi:lactoylglutathione lyase